MITEKVTARIVGVLFILASVAAIVGGSLLLSLDEPDYLEATAANDLQVVSGVLIELILVLSVIGIAVMIYPILRRWDSGLALSYVGARTIEGVLLMAAAVTGLLVMSLGEAYTLGEPGVQPVGDTLLAAREWTYLLGSLVALGVSALVLNGILYRSSLVPGWLAIWGLVGGGLILFRGLIEVYGGEISGLAQGLMAAPIALQEMVLAVWLIVKGFDTARLRAERADRENAVGALELV